LRPVGAFEPGFDAPRRLAPGRRCGILTLGQGVRARQHARLQAAKQIEVDALAKLDAVIQSGEVA
jgi:hypothetical protein